MESVISLPCPYLYPPYLQADSIILCIATSIKKVASLPYSLVTKEWVSFVIKWFAESVFSHWDLTDCEVVW